MLVCLYDFRFANVYPLTSRFIVSVSTMQYRVISLKVMHKKVQNLEFRRIDVYTFLTF